MTCGGDRSSTPASYEDLVLLVLDLPNRKRAQRGWPHRFAASQGEAGMMPGTADRVADHQTLRERAVIVAAKRFDRQHLGANLHQKHLVVPDMTEQLAFGEVGKRHA